MPSIPISGNIATAPLVSSKASSIGPVGKIPRGQGIPESQLPKRFRRPLISQEECDAINVSLYTFSECCVILHYTYRKFTCSSASTLF